MNEGTDEHLPIPANTISRVEDCGGLCTVCVAFTYQATIRLNTQTAINRHKTAEQLLNEVTE